MSDAKREEELGMKRAITRRDFLNGAALAVGGTLALSGNVWAEVFGLPKSPLQSPMDTPAYYPPAKTGLRGSHDGSWEVAHDMRDGKQWGKAVPDNESYDLIVVGAGISGLAAAYFYRQQAGPKSRILILDNHDDFGGHAKRNEFHPGGRLLIGYGGTQSIAGPQLYSPQAKALFSDLGIEVARFEKYFDRQFFASRGLSQGIFFDKETFGVDRTVAGIGKPSWPEFAAKTPLSEKAQKDLARLYTDKIDYLPNKTPAEKKFYLARTSYKEFLLNDVRVDPAVISYFQSSTYGLYGVGIEAVPAGDLAGLKDHPGFQGMDLSGPLGPGIGLEVTRQDAEPYIYHFPDGNASVARLLVRKLVPTAAPGGTMEDIVLAKMDYSKLDVESSLVRIRLNSTVINAQNEGGAASAKEVTVTYVCDGQARSVRGSACVLACWNMAIPYLCPEISATQKEALAYGVKVPLVYANVQLRNRTAFEKLKLSGVTCPGSYFSGIALDFPVSIGGYEYPKSADEPCVIHMQHVPCSPGLPARDQQRAGRNRLFATKFETFERNIRDQLSRVLGPSFDPAQDIQAITVNRWPHGYAYEYNSLYDPEWPAGQSPCEIGRKPFGRIHIANSDAGAFAYTNEAIDQGYRAVAQITKA